MARCFRLFVLWSEWWGDSTVWVFRAPAAWIRPTDCGRPEQVLGVLFFRGARQNTRSDRQQMTREANSQYLHTYKEGQQHWWIYSAFTVQVWDIYQTLILAHVEGDYKRSFFATFTIHCFLCNIHDTLSFQLQRNNSTGKPCVHTNMLHETIVVKIIISFIFSKVYEFILIHNIANCYYKQSVYSSSTQHCLQLTVKLWLYKKINSYFEMPCGLHITDRCR